MWEVTQSLAKQPHRLARRSRAPWAFRARGGQKGRRRLMLLTAIFFAFLFVQTYLFHYRMLTSLEGSPALAPIFVSLLGMVTALALATWLQPHTVVFYRFVMGLAVAVGVVGVFFHIRSQPPSLAELWGLDFWLGRPPPAAPLSFVIAGLLGLTALWNLRWEPEAPEDDLVEAPSAGDALSETADLYAGGES